MGQSRRFALLIGVNQYFDKPLAGCVPDVRVIQQHLESRPMPMQIDVLTASEPSTPGTNRPSEDEKYWPTLDNVVSHLEAITASAHAGDSVYMHFSGHGTSLGVVPGSRHLHKSTADLALDLLGPNGDSVRYLRGRDLAYYLKKMVSKGLRVTLVLDCCFSGSVLRGSDEDDATLRVASDRFLPYDAETDAASPVLRPEAESKADPDPDVGEDGDARDGSFLPNWFVRPDGYAILTACGPHEMAREIDVDGIGRTGALSHFLMRTLSRLGTVDARLGDIYQSVCSRFADRSWLQDVKQTPMLFGNEDLTFLGFLKPSLEAAGIPVFRSPQAQLMLRAGRAHGMLKGDRLDLYPLAAAAEPSHSPDRAVRARIADAADLTSTLRGVGGKRLPASIGVGWTATLVSRSSLRAIPISISPNLPGFARLLEASKSRPELALRIVDDASARPGSFSVVAAAAGTHYEIRDDAGNAVAGFGPAPLVDKRVLDRVLDALEHLTRFRQVEAIANPPESSSFLDGAFAVRVRSPGGSWRGTQGRIDAVHEVGVELELRNDGPAPLYFHTYSLGPLWQVQNIFDGDHEEIPARDETRAFAGSETLDLETCVPQQLLDAGQTWCDDVIKILVTDQATSFAPLTMATLSDVLASKSELPLADLRQLSIFDDDGEDDAGLGWSRGGPGRWAAVNVYIRTSC